MRHPRGTLISAIVAVILAAGCDGNQVLSDYAEPPPLPASINCGDAAALEALAATDLKQSDEVSSYPEKIYARNRANFISSLAIIARLKCKVAKTNVNAAGPLVEQALAKGSQAARSDNMYETAWSWAEAETTAKQAINLLLTQPPLSVPAK